MLGWSHLVQVAVILRSLLPPFLVETEKNLVKKRELKKILRCLKSPILKVLTPKNWRRSSYSQCPKNIVSQKQKMSSRSHTAIKTSSIHRTFWPFSRCTRCSPTTTLLTRRRPAPGSLAASASGLGSAPSQSGTSWPSRPSPSTPSSKAWPSD